VAKFCCGEKVKIKGINIMGEIVGIWEQDEITQYNVRYYDSTNHCTDIWSFLSTGVYRARDIEKAE